MKEDAVSDPRRDRGESIDAAAFKEWDQSRRAPAEHPPNLAEGPNTRGQRPIQSRPVADHSPYRDMTPEEWDRAAAANRLSPADRGAEDSRARQLAKQAARDYEVAEADRSAEPMSANDERMLREAHALPLHRKHAPECYDCQWLATLDAARAPADRSAEWLKDTQGYLRDPFAPADRPDEDALPRTKAGRFLLDREKYNERAFPLIEAGFVIAIENEAAALSPSAGRDSGHDADLEVGPDLTAGRDGLDNERLGAAMNEAYDPFDDPLVDDSEWWRSFATKVLAALSEVDHGA